MSNLHGQNGAVKGAVLVVNCGSSSLKFQLFDRSLDVLVSGLIENIGAVDSHVRLSDGLHNIITEQNLDIHSHHDAVVTMVELIESAGWPVEHLGAIGHRVVHGGEMFREPVLVTEQVVSVIERLEPLAPLHNPVNLEAMKMAMKLAPGVPQVAVFDTAFHQTVPEYAFLYALPYKFYEQYRIRRYGFHGSSHSYVSRKAAEFKGVDYGKMRIITLHLGNGASAAAVKHGRCVDTSMGFTPLEGLVMGTRSGDLDPAIHFYLGREAGMDMDAIDGMLNRESGLTGICGENDMRIIIDKAQSGDRMASLALEIFCYRIKKYIGAYFAVLGGVDCIVFTGGIGEHASVVREMSLDGLESMGICLDTMKNNEEVSGVSRISHEKSCVDVLVVPTDEELEIAYQVLRTLSTIRAA